MRKVLAGYRIMIYPNYVDIRTYSDSWDQSFSETPEFIELDGLVQDEVGAIEAVKKYFEKAKA
jgi:hypothetical protein